MEGKPKVPKTEGEPLLKHVNAQDHSAAVGKIAESLNIEVGDIAIGDKSNQNTINIGGVTNIQNSMTGGSSPAELEGMTPEQEREAMEEAFKIEDQTEETLNIEDMREKEEPLKIEDLREENAKLDLDQDALDALNEKMEKEAVASGAPRTKIEITEDGVVKKETEQERKERESNERTEKALDAVNNPSKESLEIMQTTRAAREAKKAFEDAYKKELEEQNAGMFKGGINRVKDRFFGKGIEMSQHVRDLQEAYFDVESRRRTGRYERLISKTNTNLDDKVKMIVTPAMRDESGKIVTPAVTKEVTKREKIQDSLNKKIRKDFENEQMMRYEAISKEKSPTLEKMGQWLSKRSRAERLAYGALLFTGIGVASGTVAAGGAMAYGGYRLARGATAMLAGGAAIKGLSVIQRKSTEKLSVKMQKELDESNPFANMAAAQEAFRTNQSNLSANERKWMRRQIGTGILFGGLAGGLASGGIDSVLENVRAGEAADAAVGSVETNPTYPGDYNPELDPNASFERGGVPPIDGSLDGSPEWQGQAPSGYEAQEAPIKATSMEIGTEGSYSEHVNGKIDGGIEAMEEFRAQLRAEYPDTPRPDVVEKILSYENSVEAAKAFGFFHPEADVPNMTGAESFVLQPGDTFGINESGEFVFTHNGEEQVLLSDSGERGDAVVGDVQKVSAIEAIKDEFKNYTQVPSSEAPVNLEGALERPPIPEGADPSKIYYDGTNNQYYAYAEYAADQAGYGIQPGSVSFYEGNGIAEPSAPAETVQVITTGPDQTLVDVPVYEEPAFGRVESGAGAPVQEDIPTHLEGIYEYFSDFRGNITTDISLEKMQSVLDPSVYGEISELDPKLENGFMFDKDDARYSLRFVGDQIVIGFHDVPSDVAAVFDQTRGGMMNALDYVKMIYNHEV